MFANRPRAGARCSRLLLFAAACLLGTTGSDGGPVRSKPRALPAPPPAQPQAAGARAANLLNGLSLVFEPNLGQTDPQVRFLTRASGMISFLTDRENVMVLSRRKDKPDPRDPHKTPEIEQTIVRMKLEGARTPRAFEGLEKAESISNYFLGSDPSKWVANIPNYGKVRARGVYEGIDLVYYGDGRKLEYDFVVRPGADPSRIRVVYDGGDSLSLDGKGNLRIATRLGTLVQRKPKVYQEIGGERMEIEASYIVRNRRVEFALAGWDRNRELIIDPVLEYSTYLGGSGSDQGIGIAVDSTGAAYVTGLTRSTNFPTTAGAFQTAFAGDIDAFVTKLNAAGTALVYSTYLGGNSFEEGLGIAVDSAGSAHITGRTGSANFPTTAGAFLTAHGGGVEDTFVTKLNAAGTTLVYSTYLGGSSIDQGFAIAVDSAGEAHVTGFTQSTNFPTTVGAFQTAFGGAGDAFVTKLNAAGTALVYSSYLGGSNTEFGLGIALDSAGNAYIAGRTGSTNFPTTAGAFQTAFAGGLSDAYVTKLNAAGSALVYSTYLGGTLHEDGDGIAVGSTGEAYIAGLTGSANFPTTPGAFQTAFGGGVNDAFVTKLNAAGSALVYSTYLGGNSNESGEGIAVDVSGDAYITGLTSSANFPTSPCAFQTTFGGASDAFVTKLNASASALLFSTFLGGGGDDAGFAIAVDLARAVYVTGNTGSTNFPTTPGAFQTAFGGGTFDAIVTKFNLTPPVPTSITAASGTPQSAAVGAAFAAPLEVLVTDAAGNPVGGATVTFMAPGSGASATLSVGTQVTDCSGKARINATANTVAGSYVVTASVAGAGTPANFNLTNIGGPPSGIAFVQQPTDTQSAQPITPAVTVSLKDSSGNPIGGASIMMSLQGGGPLNGTTAQTTNAMGVATFADLSIAAAGTYMLQATSGTLTATSASFRITAGSGNTLVFVQQPSNTAAGQTIAPPVTVQVRDGAGNPAPVAGIPITLTLASGTGTLLGTLVQPTNANGVATFPDLRIDAVGTKTLRATGPQLSPVESNPFQIGAAPVANIAVFSGSPQSTTVGQPFASVLQAQVTDTTGNPVSGVSVTFEAPASGPSGTFAGATTVVTGANGVATAPVLTANNTAGSFVVRATVAGVISFAAFTLTNLPQQPSPIAVNPTTLAFASEINQPAPPGQTVQIQAGAGVSWTVSSSASWLTALPGGGTGSGQLTVSVNPAGLAVGVHSGVIRVTEPAGGVAQVQVTYTITAKPALVISPPLLVFTTPSNTVTPAAQTLTATSSSGTIAYSVAANVSTPGGGNWLQISTPQGQTPGTVQVRVNPAGLANGVFDGLVRFTPTDTTLNAVAVPVTLSVACDQGGCLQTPNIIEVVHAANFQPGGAPRAIMTIFGTNLSDGVYQAQDHPLPTQLGPTSVTVNGAPAPLYFASPMQINFQMPGNVAGTATVVVRNEATVSVGALSDSRPHEAVLTPVQPGLFLTSDRRAAALNGDLSPNTAANPVPGGGHILLFLTGEGPVTPPVPDGMPAPAQPLSMINAPVTVVIGGRNAQVTFQGAAPGFAGLAQINAIVPADLPAGDHPVFVTIAGQPSNGGVIAVK